MKLYIDGLFYKCSGIGRYYESLTKEFAKRGIKIYTCVYKNLKTDFERDFADTNNIEPLFVDYKKFSLRGFLVQSKILGSLQRKVDLFFFPHINLPYYVPERKNIIITIHDIIPLYPIYTQGILKRKIFYFLLKRALKYSKKVICVSNFVAGDLIKNFSSISQKIKVIYEFVDDKFVKQETYQNIKRLVEKPYILYVGNRKRHKNLGLLVKALAKVKNKIPHYLVIAGRKDKGKDEVDILIEKFWVQERIIQYLNPPDNIIINLFKYADLFVFPSLIEGFGLPPLEAVSLGCPVILSDISVLREIFGDAGFYFNPYDEDDLANVIVKLLSDSNLKNELLCRQKQRIKIFSKEKIIDQYISLFNELINSKL